ncbi:MAG: hypothetical protein A2600_09025 [Candidatus Lambdaproteobacteria bacterium RIFOXYD1_FULL_56_27]|uniref:DUF4405 domain-containing protein n=1 Tax=Candidatus Lambdaproteobacteria bacterium RIFOXYD2_FULL_56_26 TaxID=1817773 RepID=A0A1F6GYS4_9PROT|nr:MAG: hypothetical protein A2426_10445 [Candidatus Lambdaproteobacteria bacterium RIFOXYC1_FULL_56_13]OGH03323.1 MAG: hypothetical protein A2557_02240 [Candidatus Lambdaproteobacteria bacterium RIFOXYD2_FULL_56_26]OGH06672.1 MAG: hypothetical protein A2600_09025 [Candidatus Lambdaproteobacteria bacterium RIFOXYD1_FULL_56_27]
MKLLVKTSSLLVILSGLVLTSWLLGENETAIWVHLLLGFGYTVLFLLFSMDHLSAHGKGIKRPGLRNLTGVIQLFSGGLALATGFILYLYGSKALSPWTEIHLASTLVFLAALLAHFTLKRTPPR